MAAYETVVSTRTTSPDLAGLLTILRATIAPEVGVHLIDAQHYVVKKADPWTAAQISAAQSAIDGAAAQTPQRAAQTELDQMSVFQKAIVLTILDQFNLVRSKLVPPLPAVTVAQMLAAIRTKAGEL